MKKKRKKSGWMKLFKFKKKDLALIELSPDTTKEEALVILLMAEVESQRMVIRD